MLKLRSKLDLHFHTIPVLITKTVIFIDKMNASISTWFWLLIDIIIFFHNLKLLKMFLNQNRVR